LINIPELQRFKNLDLKEMMTHRWSRSHWYQTKLVGDAMTSMLTRDLPASRPEDWRLSDAVMLYDRLRSVTDHFLVLMQLPDWYIWESPEHLASAEEHYEEIEKDVLSLVFGD
jgi:hypothetical protein